MMSSNMRWSFNDSSSSSGRCRRRCLVEKQERQRVLIRCCRNLEKLMMLVSFSSYLIWCFGFHIVASKEANSEKQKSTFPAFEIITVEPRLPKESHPALPQCSSAPNFTESHFGPKHEGKQLASTWSSAGLQLLGNEIKDRSTKFWSHQLWTNSSYSPSMEALLRCVGRHSHIVSLEETLCNCLESLPLSKTPRKDPNYCEARDGLFQMLFCFDQMRNAADHRAVCLEALDRLKIHDKVEKQACFNLKSSLPHLVLSTSDCTATAGLPLTLDDTCKREESQVYFRAWQAQEVLSAHVDALMFCPSHPRRPFPQLLPGFTTIAAFEPVSYLTYDPLPLVAVGLHRPTDEPGPLDPDKVDKLRMEYNEINSDLVDILGVDAKDILQDPITSSLLIKNQLCTEKNGTIETEVKYPGSHFLVVARDAKTTFEGRLMSASMPTGYFREARGGYFGIPQGVEAVVLPIYHPLRRLINNEKLRSSSLCGIVPPRLTFIGYGYLGAGVVTALLAELLREFKEPIVGSLILFNADGFGNSNLRTFLSQNGIAVRSISSNFLSFGNLPICPGSFPCDGRFFEIHTGIDYLAEFYTGVGGKVMFNADSLPGSAWWKNYSQSLNGVGPLSRCSIPCYLYSEACPTEARASPNCIIKGC